MQLSVVTRSSLLLVALVAGGCSQEAAVRNDQAPVAAVSTTTPAYAEFNTSNTIRDVMNTLIDPSADALWTAVRFEMDENGSREIKPETDEDWAALRRHAIAIVEGANALMIPGRNVAPPGATTEFPAYEYVPEEVDAKLREDWQSWLAYAQGLQNSALAVMAAIDARELERFSENGGALDQACESCHMQYWYRAQSL
jgi:hypothetical protein